jgi:hypothetical protein
LCDFCSVTEDEQAVREIANAMRDASGKGGLHNPENLGAASLDNVLVESSLAASERRETDSGHSLIKPAGASNACRGWITVIPLTGADCRNLLFVKLVWDQA